MENIVLLNQTPNEKINKIITALIYFYKNIVNENLLGIYIIGSYANEKNIINSDLDVSIILDNVDKNVIENLYEFSENLNFISNIGLDVAFYNISELTNKDKILAINILLKSCSLHVFGKDIIEQIEFPEIKKYQEISINRALYFISRIRPYLNKILNLNTLIEENITRFEIPDSSKDFFGYAEKTMENTEGKEIPITKELVNITTLIGSTILAFKNVYIGDKNSSVIKYREVINDEWTEHIEDTYYFCREKYKYLIPQEKSEQRKLKEICKKTLEFENYFLDFIQKQKFE